MVNISHNPFIIGQPVPPGDPAFVGRKTEIATAFDQIHNRSNLALWGGSGIGKSSLLEQLTSPKVWQQQEQDRSQAVIVLFSCLNISPFRSTSFWEEVLSLVRDEMDNDSQLQAQIKIFLEQGQATKDSLRRVLRKLGKKGKFLLLLVDDYDAALIPNEQYTEADIETFLSECRSLAYHSRERQYLSMIVTSSRRLNKIGPPLKPGSSPWYNHYLFQQFKAFTEAETQELLGKTMTLALQEGVRDIAGGNPALLQIAGYLLYRATESGTKQMADVEAFAKEFESAARHYFQDIWSLSNELEQTLLMLLALSNLKGRLHNQRYDLRDLEIILSQKGRELTNLEERGVISYTVEEGKKQYFFSSSIMERWVIQELSNSDDVSLENRKKILLNLMSREQAKEITTAIQWLWQYKEEMPATLEWIGRIVKALPQGFLFG
ncbi:MAG: ATP-binding protein [Symploca sp. SIO2E6]|nr:ATP-binding protein [Symploca sp. SIO2E6]